MTDSTKYSERPGQSSMVKYARTYTYITGHMQAMNIWNVRKIGLVPSLIA